MFRVFSAVLFGASYYLSGSAAFSASLDPTGFSQVAGAFGGSFLIGRAGEELRETIDHAEAAGLALIEEGNQAAKDRIEQIDKVLSKTVGGLIDKSEEAALLILEQAKRDIEDIEAQIYSDIISAIREAECAANRTMVEIIDVTLRGALPGIITGNTRKINLPYPIEEPFLLVSSVKTTEFEIDLNAGHPPDVVFAMIEDAYLESIANVSETDNAYGILSAYANLSKLARHTMCLYEGHASSLRWTKAYLKYQNLLYPWEKTLNVRN